jgi:hypothetical protein
MSVHVEQFQQLANDWNQYQNFIEKIQSQAAQFSSKVVEKLQAEYVEKQKLVTSEIEAFLQIQGTLLAETKAALATLKHNNAAYDEVEQELTLRHAIGAISDEDYQTELNALKSSMSDYASQVDAYNADIDGIEGMFAAWEHMSGSAIVIEAVEEPVVESPVVEEAVIEEANLIEPNSGESFDFPGEDLGQLPEIAELEDALDPIEDLDADLEFNDVNGPSPFATIPGEDLNFELSNDSLGFDEGLDLSAELIDPDDFSGSIDLGNMSMDADVPSAMLIRDEGVQGSEAIFPFKGDTYRIGRAPDNNIQIKDDSKVSRHHCELSRRGNQFYLVDLGSSNGTMVNGDAFEGEFKLYGGEELKVGETLFRFTIQ